MGIVRFKDKYRVECNAMLAEGVAVVCPKCSGEGTVRIYKTDQCKDCPWGKYECGRGFRLAFACGGCGAVQTKEEISYRLVAEGVCENCERFFREEFGLDKSGFKAVRLPWPPLWRSQPSCP